MNKEAVNFIPLRDALLNEEWETVASLLTVASGLEKWAKGLFTVVGDKFLYQGHEIPVALNERIVAMATAGEDPTRWFKFWERLKLNSSWRSINQLPSFLKNRNIPLDNEGYLITYKSVRSDYTDWHTGKISNKVGVTNEMPRNEISDDPNEACHVGFHVGALEYAQGFGSEGKRIIVCRVDPQDVVCVPYDSSPQKMRVCRYTVIANHGAVLPSTTVDSEELISTEPETEESTELKFAFDMMDDAQLMEQSLKDLRKYAQQLKIARASKLAGGKPALLLKIMEVRRK